MILFFLIFIFVIPLVGNHLGIENIAKQLWFKSDLLLQNSWFDFSFDLTCSQSKYFWPIFYYQTIVMLSKFQTIKEVLFHDYWIKVSSHSIVALIKNDQINALN